MGIEHMGNEYFSFINETVFINIIDNDYEFAQLIKDALRKYNIYKVQLSTDYVADITTLNYNIFILNMDNYDENDGLELINKLSRETIVIVLSEDASMEKGFNAGLSGARNVIKKIKFSEMCLINEINKIFLESIVIPPAFGKLHFFKEALSLYRDKSKNVEKMFDINEFFSQFNLIELNGIYMNLFNISLDNVAFLYNLYNRAINHTANDSDIESINKIENHYRSHLDLFVKYL